MIRRTLFILIGGATALLLILIGIAAFIFWPMITSAHTSQTTNATPTVPAVTTTPTQQAGTGVAKLLRQYVPDIKTQIAQGLKLSPEQLTAQLRTGKTLSDVATTQGVSKTQLQTIVSNALETSLKPAVDDGTLTQKQLDKLAKRYASNPTLLDRLLGGKATKATPTITPTPVQ